MVKGIGKVKKAVRSVNREEKKAEAESSHIPRTMIFSKAGAGAAVRRLTEDLRAALGPFTTSTLKCRRGNKMRHFIDNAGPLGVKNILYLSETGRKTPQWGESANSKAGDIYCHVICVPHGPTFTYKVKEFSLKKDIQTVSGFAMNSNWLQQPPLLLLSGFSTFNNKAEPGNADDSDLVNAVNAVSLSWQNMLPKTNVSKQCVRSLRRALLISRHEAMPEANENVQAEFGEVFVLRHYNIKLENKELSRNVKKLGIGAASRNVKIPDLGKYGSIEEVITRSGYNSESDMSDIDEPATVDLVEQMRELPGSTGKTAIKMMEVGPRITFQLIKIEAGVNAGAVIYHRYIKKTAEEIFEIDKKRQDKLRLKEQRRKEQEKNVADKKKVNDAKDKRQKRKAEDNDSGSETNVLEDNIATENMNEDENIEEEEDIEDGDDEESEGIEDINDSLDEDIEDDNLKDDSESDILLEDDDSDIENVDDSMDDDISNEDDEDSDENQVLEYSKKCQIKNDERLNQKKQTINSLKRSVNDTLKIKKKRKM